MHGAQERNLQRAGPSITHSGLHTVNKLLAVLLLRAPMCRASVRTVFSEGRAVLLHQNVDYAVLRNVQSPCV